MLSGKAFTNGQGYAENHLKSNDYYEKGKTVTGYWLGKACADFGVQEGQSVTDKEFEALRNNLNPVTGEQLTFRNNTTRTESVNLGNELVSKEISNRRSFYDFTMSAPKSFSVMAVTLDDNRIRSWHDKAVRKAISEMELYTSRQDHRTEDIERTGKFCTAHFKHDANRSLEPQIHDHIVIFNATPSSNGNNYAIEFGEFYKRCKYITAVYRDELAREAINGGYEIEIDDQGAPQIKNTDDITKHFSGRTRIIEQHVKRIEDEIGTVLSNSQKKLISFASRGFDEAKFNGLYNEAENGSNWTKESFFNEYLKLISRASDSTLVEATTPDVIENQKKSLSEEQLKRLEHILEQSIHHERQIKAEELERLSSHNLRESMEYSKDHHIERKSVIKDYDYFTTVLNHSLGRGTDLKMMKNYLSYMMEDNELIKIKDEIATREHLEQELNIINYIKEGKNKFEEITKGDFNPSEKLNEEQKTAVNEIISSRDQFNALIGRAGTGKTFTVSEIVRANIENGYDVLLCAPSNGARDVLREDGKKIRSDYNQPLTAKPFEEAVSLQKLLIDESLQSKYRANSLIILDESGMASLKQLNELGVLARKNNWRVLQVGDIRQHISVEAGDGFRIELKYSDIKRCQLKNIQRQKKTAMKGKYRQIAIDLAFGRIAEAFNSLDKLGAIIEVKNYDMYKKLAEEYIRYYEKDKSVIVVNTTHKENLLASESIREKLKEKELIRDERKMTVNIPLNWTNAQKTEYKNYKSGMIIESVRGKDKGYFWTVETVDPKKGLICISAKGKHQTFIKDNLIFYDICAPKEIMLGIGDKIMLRTGEKNRTWELINGEILQVKGFDSSGNIITNDNKVITTRKFTYGYASTSHKAQGKTTEAVLIAFDRFSVRFADKKTAYVAGTRGVEEMKIFCENKQDLIKIDSKDGDRKSVLELIENKRQEISEKRKTGIINALSEFTRKVKQKLNLSLGFNKQEYSISRDINLEEKQQPRRDLTYPDIYTMS